jgi:4-diphosphocytidyl-2C-methyl-D-erythritol kinase
MQKISLYDEIIIKESDEYSLIIENHPELSKEGNNLITKAYKALKLIRPNIPDLRR